MPSSDNSTILVVEDDDIVRMLMVDILEELDYRVLEAAGWDSAISALQSDTGIDLLITDVGLCDTANRTGLELVVEAQKLRPSIPVLVASGYGSSLDLPQGAQLLPKPFNLDKLRETVNALVPQRAARS
ncbi:response regulator [Pseudomonas sp. RIT-PI-S]|uniref:response regulator n=1 Tax=Pseudomonas sp. RIT-PI-S TaxID=3035295 RepID=UPI0021D99C41|nr:response regulator [Pseudomonas sp. RIT-PI-S]